MRFYLVLFGLLAVFVFAARQPIGAVVADVAYDARVAYVCAFGKAGDYEELIDYTQRMHAAERGTRELYQQGKRYQELIAQRVAAATRQNIELSDDELERIRQQCRVEAFGRRELSCVDDRKMLAHAVEQ